MLGPERGRPAYSPVMDIVCPVCGCCAGFVPDPVDKKPTTTGQHAMRQGGCLKPWDDTLCHVIRLGRELGSDEIFVEMQYDRDTGHIHNRYGEKVCTCAGGVPAPPIFCKVDKVQDGVVGPGPG